MGQGLLVRLPYVHEVRDAKGNVRRYFRRLGWPSVKLPGAPGSPKFQAAYARAMLGTALPEPQNGPGTISAAIAAYYKDGSFRILAPGTQRGRREILERFRERDGTKQLAGLRREHIEKMLGAMKPFAARNWLKTLRGLMQFARRDTDPTVGIKPVRAKAGTIHTWSEDEIEIFERHHAVGTRARLAMGLLLYTAARRGDAIHFGPQHIRAGRLVYRQQKTGRALAIPLHPELRCIIATSPPTHALTFLVNVHGQPFASGTFYKQFARWCAEAGIPHCSAHGLRKAAARRLAEAGCSAHEIASITGHRTLSEVQRYTDAADQVRMADAAMQTVSASPTGTIGKRKLENGNSKVENGR